MALTAAQLLTLKSDLAVNVGTIPAGQPWSGSFVGIPVNAVPNFSDGNAAVAGWYNLPATPTFTVWRKLVSIQEVGNNLNGTELAGLTSVNHTRLQTVVMLSQSGIDASLGDRRQFFDDIFSGTGGATTRAQLLTLWKRTATAAQKLFATGTGSVAFPATTAANIGDNFGLTGSDIMNALNQP